MKLEFTYFNKEKELIKITGLNHEELWKYVCLDDWDYGLIVETGDIIPKNKLGFDYELSPPNGIGGLLHGCCDNRWKYIKGKNKNFICGMAYHA